jgi:GT2 family glycosyltransferase
MEPTVELGIVIVTWNSAGEVLQCLESIARHPPDCRYEVVVVDNCSADGTVAAVERAAPWARVIANPENRGLAVANNQGLLATAADVVVLSNADVVFQAGALDAFRAAFARHPRAAFVVPRSVFDDGVVQTMAGELPSLTSAFVGRQAQWWRRTGSPSGWFWDGWGHDRECQVGRAGDVCYAARRDAVAEIGPQDERFPLDWEGVDWSARACALGWEIWFDPAAEVVHLGGASTGRAPSTRWVVATHRGMYRYFANRRPRRAPLLAVMFSLRALVKLAVIRAGVPMHRRALNPGAAGPGSQPPTDR